MSAKRCSIHKEQNTLKTNLASSGVVTLNEQKEKQRLVLHALYAVPIKRGENTHVIEDLMPVYNTVFEINTEREIKRVAVVDTACDLPFEYKDGICRFTIPEFTSSVVVTLDY